MVMLAHRFPNICMCFKRKKKKRKHWVFQRFPLLLPGEARLRPPSGKRKWGSTLRELVGTSQEEGTQKLARTRRTDVRVP